MHTSEAGRVDTDIARRNFEDAVRTHEQLHERFFLARLLGLTFSYEGETCEVTFEAESFMFNPKSSLHGGIVCLVMDASMGHLLHHLGQPSVTLEIKTQFLRSIQRGRLRTVASVLQRGRSLSYTICNLYDEEGRLVAFASATWKSL